MVMLNEIHAVIRDPYNPIGEVGSYPAYPCGICGALIVDTEMEAFTEDGPVVRHVRFHQILGHL